MKVLYFLNIFLKSTIINENSFISDVALNNYVCMTF